MTLLGLLLASESGHAYADPQKKNLAIFIFGSPGTPQFQHDFEDARADLGRVLEANGFGPEQQRVLKGDGQTLQTELAKISKKTYGNLFIFVAGHANGRDEQAMLHLPGQDRSYAELMPLIEKIHARQRILVAAVPQAHVWAKRFSGKGQIVLAGNARREFDFIPAQFLKIFPAMFTKAAERQARDLEAGPANVSLAEVFLMTSRRVERWYKRNHLLATEIPVLEADGDGRVSAVFLEKNGKMKSSKRKKRWVEDVAEAGRLHFVIPWVGGNHV